MDHILQQDHQQMDEVTSPGNGNKLPSLHQGHFGVNGSDKDISQ